MAGASARKIVLVVEDEPVLRMMAVDLAEQAGFDTVEASNAAEAICTLEGRNDIRIVFTDIDMPGSMDGLKLAAAIRGRWPPIEIIVTSGQFTPKPGDLPERGVFFSKPYRAEDLVRTLQSLA